MTCNVTIVHFVSITEHIISWNICIYFILYNIFDISKKRKISLKIFNIFYALICGVQVTWPKQFKLRNKPAVADIIVWVDALIRSTLHHSVRELKATHTNMQLSLQRELLMINKFEIDHYVAEANKNIHCTKSKVGWWLDGWRNVTRVARTSMIRQAQVRLKPWIARTCSTPSK